MRASVCVAFKGYTPGELDTIITERYVQGSRFSQKVDSFIVTDTNVFTGHDTLTRINPTPNYYQGFADLKNGYDYMIVVPSVNRRYQITDVTFRPDTTFTYQADHHGCTTAGMPNFTFCTGLKLDNQSVLPAETFRYPNTGWPSSAVSMLYLSR